MGDVLWRGMHFLHKTSTSKTNHKGLLVYCPLCRLVCPKIIKMYPPNPKLVSVWEDTLTGCMFAKLIGIYLNIATGHARTRINDWSTVAHGIPRYAKSPSHDQVSNGGPSCQGSRVNLGVGEYSMSYRMVSHRTHTTNPGSQTWNISCAASCSPQAFRIAKALAKW